LFRGGDVRLDAAAQVQFSRRARRHDSFCSAAGLSPRWCHELRYRRTEPAACHRDECRAVCRSPPAFFACC